MSQAEMNFDDNSILYLQIHRIKLQDYFQSALIVPDIYLGENTIKDTQSIVKSKLLLSTGYFQDLDEEQVLLEILLTDEEKTGIQESILLFDKPLPISRVKVIYCKNKKAKEKILISAKSYDAYFLPSDRIEYFTKIRKTLKLTKIPALDNKTEKCNFDLKIIKYDKLLGMVTFMKNMNLYYSEKLAQVSNYSDNYFKVLNVYNTLIPKIGNEPFFNEMRTNTDFFNLIMEDKSLDDKFIMNLISNTVDPKIKGVFQKLLDDPLSKVESLEKLRENRHYFYICLVYIYRNKKSNEKEILKASMTKNIPFELAEISLAFLGLYYGYTSLRASEEIEIKDKYFKEIFGSEFNVKFRLDSKLDYVTIESIYNYCFHVKRGADKFAYLTYPEAPPPFDIPNDKEFDRGYEVIKNETILEAPYLKIRKLSDIEILQKRLDGYPDEIKLGEHHIFSYFAKYSSKQNDSKTVSSKDEFLEILIEITPEQYRELTCLFEADGK